jgi:hypothetical protein
MNPDTETKTNNRQPSRSRQSARQTGRLYEAADRLSGLLIYFLLVFSPWALGSTYRWAAWVDTWAAFALGALLILKVGVRRFSPIVPARWGGPEQGGGGGRGAFWVGFILAMNILAMLYILASAVNSRASWDPAGNSFTYRQTIHWLPQTYDRDATWFVFWYGLGISLFFWAARDWMTGKTASETELSRQDSSAILPRRLSRLLWILSVNTGLLAIEGIIQRLEGSGRLLFLVTPRFDTEASQQFGPWAYRGTAAEYFNLVWPVIIGFWFWRVSSSERRGAKSARVGSDPRSILPPLAVLVAASPIIASSRGGAIVAGLLVGGTIFLSFVFRGRASLAARISISVVLLAGLGLGAYLGWDTLQPRLVEMLKGDSSNRGQIYKNLPEMTRDFYLLGSGPGSFAALYQLYRQGPLEDWAAYAHNDWVELLITFGVFGGGFVILALLAALGRYFRGGGLAAPPFFYGFVVLGMLGCLAHAVFDVPMEAYSVLFLFIFFCAILSVIGRRGAARGPSAIARA